MTRVSVLFEMDSSRKEMCEERDRLVFAIESELTNVGKSGILAYFSCERDHQSVTTDVYILQRWSLRWQAFVDVTDVDQIEDGDRLTVIRQPHLQEDSTGFDSSKVIIRLCQLYVLTHLTKLSGLNSP